MEGRKNDLNIGVLVDWFKSQYQQDIIGGIQTEAEKYKVNLFYFIGTGIKSHDLFHSFHHKVFELANASYLDHLIVFPGVVNNLTTTEALAFFDSIKTIPLVTLSFKLPDYPAILIDNESGLRALINHVIEKHQRHKLAFIAGPANNGDSNARLETYKEVLIQNKIPLDEARIVRDNLFDINSGSIALRISIEERNLIPGKDFDAIIAANDSLAVGVSEAISLYNIRIPDDVVLTGFDDSDHAQFLEIPLTTVKQPRDILGKNAIRYIVQADSADYLQDIPTQLVIRESCGCTPHIINLPYDFAEFLKMGKSPDNQLKSREILIEQISKLIISSLGETMALQQAQKIVNAFLLAIDDSNCEYFSNTFKEILITVRQLKGDINVWNHILAILRKWAAVVLLNEAFLATINSYLDQGTFLIGEMIKRKELKERVENEIYLDILHNIEESIKINIDMDKLISKIIDGLQRLGVASYHLFFFNVPGKYNSDFTLILSCINNQINPVTYKNKNYTDFTEIYEKLLERNKPNTFCILPLMESEDCFGFMIMNRIENYHYRSTYEDITIQISSTLKSQKMLNATRNAYRKLEITQKDLVKELEVARDIQTALLPGALFHEDFDIAAKMITAFSVGGDYYDLIHAPGRDWLVIGDVSGHGVHAGLIMMMVQTCVHLTLRREPHISPSGLLTAINEVITENIRKLGEQKYMTIMVLSYQGRGKFDFSGMHLPLLLYRQKTHNVEVLESSGLWLGICDNIAEYNKDDSFILDQGDCLLLYTDGVTEAEHRVNRKQLYGEGRLGEYFGTLGEKTCAEIIAGIIADLQDYTFDDDITLFALKRK